MSEVRLDRLLFLRNVPAGMDWCVVGHWVMCFRKTSMPCQPPITVEPIAGTDLFRVIDGRHRVIAAYMAGRDAIDCEIVEEQ